MKSSLFTSRMMLLFCTFLSVSSCSRIDVQMRERTSNQSHQISINDALSTLNNLQHKIEGATTKGGNSLIKKPANIVTINADLVNTKSAYPVIELSDCSDILYVVNFENDEGFALLSADDRIEDRIIAVAEKGTLSENQIYASIVRNSMRRGNITKAEIPCTTINNMGFYDEANDDYFIGDYNDQALLNRDYVEHETEIVADLCLSYVMDQLNRFDPPCDSLSGNETIYNDVSITYSAPVVNKLLSPFYGWDQGSSPFNDGLPYAWDAPIRAYTGCVNLALSKVIAYHSFPSPLTINNVPIDWSSLKTNVFSVSGRASATALLSFIYSSTLNAPFSGGTFTLPSTAQSCLQSIGYTGTSYGSYSANKVKQMLDNGCPLVISSLPRLGFLNYDFYNSHAWNIDGYLYWTKTTTIYVYNNWGFLDHTNTITETSTMVHCDWGWGGNCNGYYTSGIFNLNANDNVFDGVHFGNTTNYNFYIRIISYDNPNY